MTIAEPNIQHAFCLQIAQTNSSVQEAVYHKLASDSVDDVINYISNITDEHTIAKQLEYLQTWHLKGVSCINIFEADYPNQLRHIHKPPLIMFYKGNRELLTNYKPCIAMVGARKADIRACKITEKLAKDLADLGACVVSGLALGIDGAAHQGALNSTLRSTTIAVLGNGLPEIYPARHLDLAGRILGKSGLVITPFPPDTKPWPSNFLNRNRIIAGLSAAGIIVQAGKRSGSLSTARHLLENGREVFVVPGDIDNPLYVGSHELIKTGAQLLTNVKDLGSLIPDTKLNETQSQIELNSTQEKILQYVKDKREVNLNDILIEFPDTSTELEVCELELKQLISIEPGNKLVAT